MCQLAAAFSFLTRLRRNRTARTYMRRRSFPPLFAVAAVKMSLSLQCELQQQEVKCFGLGPICLWSVCKVEHLKTQFPGAGAVIADVALCQL